MLSSVKLSNVLASQQNVILRYEDRTSAYDASWSEPVAKANAKYEYIYRTQEELSG